MNLEAIAEYLQGEGVGAVAKTIFCYKMPDKVESAILLRDRLQGDRIDHETGLMKGGFQLIARAKTQSGAKSLAREAAVVLSMLNKRVEDMEIKYLLPRGEPVVFPVSDGQLVEALVVFDAAYSYQSG